MSVRVRAFFHWLDNFMGGRKKTPAKDDFSRIRYLPCLKGRCIKLVSIVSRQ